MLGWLYLATERWARASSTRLAKLSDHIPYSFIQQLSKAKLVRTLRYVYRHCPAQRRRWNEVGLKLSDIRSADILQYLPFTTGPEVAEHPQDYICVPQKELIYVLTTSCTKGLQKKIYLTADDFIQQVRMMGAHLRRLPGAIRVAVMFSVQDPTWSTGAVIRRGVEEAGIFGLLSGTHRSTRQQIELIREYRINCLISMPSYVGRLALEAPEDVRGLNILYIHLGAQAWTEEFRAKMQEAWGAKVLDGYGSTESIFSIASECIYQDGLHVAEADYWLEIVDPVTGKVLPEGQEGELVFTTLSRRGMPLVRYRSGDFAYLIPNRQRCKCGIPLRKMGRVKGRVDDMLILGLGENLYSDEIDRAVFSVPGVTDYQLIINEDSYKDVLHLTVEASGPPNGITDVLLKALLSIHAIGFSCEVSRSLVFGKIEIVPPGTLSRGRSKSIRIVDKRARPTAARAQINTTDKSP